MSWCVWLDEFRSDLTCCSCVVVGFSLLCCFGGLHVGVVFLLFGVRCGFGLMLVVY